MPVCGGGQKQPPTPLLMVGTMRSMRMQRLCRKIRSRDDNDDDGDGISTDFLQTIQIR
jgi:hypothetical protein